VLIKNISKNLGFGVMMRNQSFEFIKETSLFLGVFKWFGRVKKKKPEKLNKLGQKNN